MTDSSFITMSTNKKEFQSTANCLPANSTCYIVNKFEHVGGAGARPCPEEAGALNGGGGEALYRGQAEVRALYWNCPCGGQTDATENITFATPFAGSNNKLRLATVDVRSLIYV